MTTKIRGRWQQIQLHSGPVHYYGSVAQLPYLVLDKSACGPGQLVHAPDAGHVLAVDAGGVGGAGVFAHKDGGDPQTLPLQRPHLGGGVLHARAAAVVAAQRVIGRGWDAAAVVGGSVRQENEQMPRGGAGVEVDEVACGPQSQTVPVPA